jgi:hypothetical protein
MMVKDLDQTLGFALKRMEEIKWEETKEFLRKDFLDDWYESLFLHALLDFRTGSPAPLINYLRSDRPLLFDRKRLATRLETFLQKRSNGGGGRRDVMVHFLAARALRLYDVWREENIRQGVNDRGRSTDMKDEAAKIVFEQQTHAFNLFSTELELAASFEAVRETLRDLMDRPAARLKDRA